MPLVSSESSLNGVRYILSGIASEMTDAVVSGMLGVVGVVGFVLLLRSRALADRSRPSSVFTPVVINGMFPGSTPWLDIAIGACIITIFILTIVRAGLLVGDRRALHALRPAARADHVGLLELARYDRHLAPGRRAGRRPRRVLLRAQRRGREGQDFLTLTRIGVPMRPNDSRSWLTRNRS